MGSTSALLGPVSGEMSCEAVERLLASDASIELIRADDWDDVLELLYAHHRLFDVLVADFGTGGAPLIDALLLDHPNLSIAAINLGGFDTHIHNIDSRLFVTFISALGQGAAADRAGASRAAWSAHAISRLPLSRIDSTYYSADEQIIDLCGWLDAVLSRVLARSVGLADTRDIAGLTMGAGTARKLLGHADEDIESLDDAIRSAEARLRARGRGVAASTLPLQAVEHRFGLDELERRMFWLTLAPDIDDRYARVIGVINDDLSRRRPTPALLAAALGGVDGEWQLVSRLVGSRPFARFGLVAADPGDADMPWPQVALLCPRDVIELVLTGAPRRDGGLTRLVA